MQVEFRKTGERRYGVIVRRKDLPDLEMNPAPGYDTLIPHDLMHFLVEQELDLPNAIFGQIARGGTAGSFQQKPDESRNTRVDARERRKTHRKGEKMLKNGIDECAQSERATLFCLHDWYAHSGDPALRSRAEETKAAAESVYGTMTEREKRRYSAARLAAIRQRLDEISRRWSALKVDQSLTLEW